MDEFARLQNFQNLKPIAVISDVITCLQVKVNLWNEANVHQMIWPPGRWRHVSMSGRLH